MTQFNVISENGKEKTVSLELLAMRYIKVNRNPEVSYDNVLSKLENEYNKIRLKKYGLEDL